MIMKRVALGVCLTLITCIVVFLAGCQSVWSEQVSRKSNYSWQQTDNSIALLKSGQVVWQLNYDKKAAKPYFSPVRLADGMDLVMLGPADDHPWHRALWFSWTMINGVNYWEGNSKTDLTKGRAEVLDVKIFANEDYSARIEMTLGYHLPNETALLTEKRQLFVSTPDEQGGYYIDWKCSFTAGDKEVLLKGGSWGGGYGGLSVRIAENTTDWVITNSQGKQDVPKVGGAIWVGDKNTHGKTWAGNTHGKRAKWTDFTVVDPHSKKTGGIAIFDHPDNPRYPSQWHNYVNIVDKHRKHPFGYFSPAMLWSEPYTIKAEDSLTLRYRVLVHPGRTDSKTTEDKWKKFSVLKD